MSLIIPPGVSLSEIPALQPPPGVRPNFIDPESQAPGMMIANGIITAVMLVFVLLRLYTKAFLTKGLFWEDGEYDEDHIQLQGLTLSHSCLHCWDSA
jgi:hypothetical protein